MERKPRVCIVMGSKSDLPTMEHAMTMLKAFDVPYEVRILSAHRTPKETLKLSEAAAERGIQVFIAGAGGAAHLAGVIASSTILPVIGVPMQTSALGGMDSLLSIVQMPQGVPVATTAIGNAGAKNAAILAVQMMALSDSELATKLTRFKAEQAEKVLADSHWEC